MLLHIPLIPVSRSDDGVPSSILSGPSTGSGTEELGGEGGAAGAGADHLATIAAFFDAYGDRLPREWLWELLKAAMGSEQSGAWKGERRVDMMQFCERLAGLVEACYGLKD